MFKKYVKTTIYYNNLIVFLHFYTINLGLELMKKNWFVVYTKPRHEKKSAEFLRMSGIEVFLPLRKELRSWSDRKKWVEMPLFPSYLFVNIFEEDYKQVASTYGVVRFIYSDGKPAKISDTEIFSIKKLIEFSPNIPMEVRDEMFEVGDETIVRSGPLKGLKAKLVEFKGKSRIAVEIINLGKTILVEMDKSYLS